MADNPSMLNADQRAHMRYLASIPREERCASGWHVVAREKCQCGPSPQPATPEPTDG